MMLAVKKLRNSLFFSIQKLRWAVRSWFPKQRCLHHRPWQSWSLWSLLWPNNRGWGVDSVPKETGRLGWFLPRLGILSKRIWKSEWRVLARTGQYSSPDERIKQSSSRSWRLRQPNCLRSVRLVWCCRRTRQIQEWIILEHTLVRHRSSFTLSSITHI